jgi:hypothetical protein
VLPPLDSDEETVTGHPLVALYAGLARGIFPPWDGLTEVMPRPPDRFAAVLAFSGHCLVAADVDAAWVTSRCPPGDLAAPFSPDFLLALSERVGSGSGALDLVLCALGEPGDPELPLVLLEHDGSHPRVQRSLHLRTQVRSYQTPAGEAVISVGRGFTGRWEAGFEVAREHRNRGLGRALVIASRRLIPPGEPIFLQVAPGNVSSLRAILAGGFLPVGTEVLFPR